MEGFTGRPYGIYVSDEGLYVSDADGCMIWKKLNTGQTSVVTGLASLLSRLRRQ